MIFAIHSWLDCTDGFNLSCSLPFNFSLGQVTVSTKETFLIVIEAYNIKWNIW